MSVLDVGCGSGAITAGIARVVGPLGRVVGVDRDETLLANGRSSYPDLPNLRLEGGEATTLTFEAEFDCVTAARTLQWIADPARAVHRMAAAAKAGGIVVVLDYNHAANTWDPTPPPEFQRFYAAFLAWREHRSWDNRMADHLPDLFRKAGLTAIEVTNQDEITTRSAPDFSHRSTLWLEVLESLGGEVAAEGFCTAAELDRARAEYSRYVADGLSTQTLALRAITGTR